MNQKEALEKIELKYGVRFQLETFEYLIKQDKNFDEDEYLDFTADDFLYSLDEKENIIGLCMRAIGLVNIPEEINSLIHIRYLNLQINQIRDISRLNKLTLLTNLNLHYNIIKDISPLKSLMNLKTLELSHNDIHDISCLESLKMLEKIGLGENRIQEISALGGLYKMQILNLSVNKIENISVLKNLTSLQSLSINDNLINDISDLTDTKKIELLKLHNNLITDISALSNLKLLRELRLGGNKISTIEALKDLTKLQHLNLQNNLIQELPFWIIGMNMPLQLTESSSYGKINVWGNPISTPPIEIIKQGKKAIKDWFFAKKKKLNEIKLLLVGEAKAGKTSLCQRLKYNKYDADQQQTDGIVIEAFHFKELNGFKNQKKLHDTTAYFWDFGGQEIMSSTHQFFMTKRSIYVLVLEARKDAGTDKQVRNWLEKIQTFGGNSPVIIVGNKIDLNPSFGIDTTLLQKDFPQIRYFITVSCETGENIETLKSILEIYIPEAELFDTIIDERWIDIKNELQKLTTNQPRLSHRQFIDICNRHNLHDIERQTQAIEFLNDLGIVLHFDELDLSEYYVLDPLWVTTGVYRIITSETAARQKGEISTSELSQIINIEAKQTAIKRRNQTPILEYSPNECKFMADIMAQFKLSYYFDNNKKILIPDLLDKETPKADSEKFDNSDEKLSLIYEYKYLPSLIIPRVIVELKNDVVFAWRTGVLLKATANISAEAMIIAVENKIRIIVLGEYEQKRTYLSVIRYTLDQINSGYNVGIDIQIPLPGNEKYTVKYETLIKMERSGERIYKNWEIEKEFMISKLLDGIETKEQVHETLKNILEEKHILKRNRIKIFLASSLELKEDREQFEIFINRTNKELHESGVFLDLEIWEDFLDTMSKTRLQDEYNSVITNCDIFIMLFFSKVGKFTEEEFEVAFGEFKKKNKPLIYTYFKNAIINTGSINNEIMSVLSFKEKLRQLDHFVTEYKNIEELKLKFTAQLKKMGIS